jgi:predicted Zn-dependent protease
MSGIFYNLGRMAGPHVRKAKWAWSWATGTQADSLKAEYQVGLDLANEVRKQLISETDSDSARTLNEIGEKLAARVANKLRTFSFEIVKTGGPNAFALPGGFVFVTRSLLELSQWNKDEIAFIVGHEMSHIIRGHAIERIINNSAIAFGTKTSRAGGVLGTCVGSIVKNFLQSAYSQDSELEADTLGILLADAAAFDARAAIQMLLRLEKLKLPADQFDIGAYFASHPRFELRIQNAQQVLKLK